MDKRIALVLHEDDTIVIEELAGTTETENVTGRIQYHTPVQDRDHETDSLRALVRAIHSIEAQAEHYDEFNLTDLGFFSAGDDMFPVEDSEYGW